MMNTKDQTLLAYLTQFNLGTPTSIPTDILQQFGHTDESAANVEILMFELGREFEEGELPTLAAGYLIRSGFEIVTIKKKNLDSMVPESFGSTGFPHNSLVIGEDAEQDKVTIMVSYSASQCTFAKQPVAFFE